MGTAMYPYFSLDLLSIIPTIDAARKTARAEPRKH
jgi:hypothetical protein